MKTKKIALIVCLSFVLSLPARADFASACAPGSVIAGTAVAIGGLVKGRTLKRSFGIYLAGLLAGYGGMAFCPPNSPANPINANTGAVTPKPESKNTPAAPSKESLEADLESSQRLNRGN